MPKRNMFQIVKKLIISLGPKLRTFNNEFIELSYFVDELERVNFLAEHQQFEVSNPSKVALKFLSSICLNPNKHQLDCLSRNNINNLNWMKIYEGIESEHSFIDGMFASRLLGLDGYFASDRISVGLMLMLPGVIYPFHKHNVKEFYYCLSGQLLITHGLEGETFILSEGDISITPVKKLHSLEVVGNGPALLVYSWLGDLTASIQIWEKMKSGLWKQFYFKRIPGQKWRSSDLPRILPQDFLSS